MADVFVDAAADQGGRFLEAVKRRVGSLFVELALAQQAKDLTRVLD